MNRLSDVDFQLNQANNVVKMVTDSFQQIDDNEDKYEFHFKHQFRIRFAVNTCGWAAHKFIQLRKSFREKFDPLVKMKQQEMSFLQFFKEIHNEHVNEANTAEWFANYIKTWIKLHVLQNLEWEIALQIGENEETFNSKKELMKRVLIDLGETYIFEDFMEYVKNPEAVLKYKIQLYEKKWRETGRRDQQMLLHIVEKETNKYVYELDVALKKRKI